MSWKQISEEMASVIGSVGSSLVRVGAHRRTPATGIVWADGVIVTTSHSVQREESIEVGNEDGSAEASFVGRDATTDLAVLRANLAGAKAATWSEGDELRVGQLILAVARPGRLPRAELGIVSALGDAFRTSAGGRIDRWIETDADLGRGFSGSALVDAGGRIIGLNNRGLGRGRSLSVPVITVRRVVEALLARGRVERAYLGIGSLSVRLPEGLERSLGQASGLLVLSVQSDSPAERAGIVLGDVVASLDGRPVRRVGDLLEQLDEDRIGKTAKLRIVRAGEVREVEVTVGARAAA